nr:reverse transcriptase domain-containing protein [Tanacetum cinerariifolium]
MILDLPALTTPFSKETLFVYLAISRDAASAVLLVVRQGKQQPVHYVSRTLHAAERNYALLEKMTLALRHASRRLRRYFEAHPITVITDQPIKQILSKADTSGRLAPYAVELGAYNIVYEPRNAIKGQKDCKEEWTLYTDRAASAKGSGAGLVLISPTKTEYTYALRQNFESTNNQAEYEALLARLRITKKMGVQSLSIKVDYKLVASQINGALWKESRLGWEEKGNDSEAVILTKIGMPTYRMMMIKEGDGNEEEMRLNLDRLMERREAAAVREAKYKTKVE